MLWSIRSSSWHHFHFIESRSHSNACFWTTRHRTWLNVRHNELLFSFRSPSWITKFYYRFLQLCSSRNWETKRNWQPCCSLPTRKSANGQFSWVLRWHSSPHRHWVYWQVVSFPITSVPDICNTLPARDSS